MPGPRWILPALLTAAALALPAADPREAGAFTPQDGRFSIRLNGTPKVQEEPFPATPGSPAKRTTYALEKPTYVLLIGILDLRKGSSTRGQEESYFNQAFDTVRTGKMASQFVLDPKNPFSDTPLGKFKGKEMRGTVQGMRVRIRAYLTPRAVYMIQVLHLATDHAAAAEVETSLRSFKVLKG